MIRFLSIQNLAVVDALELELHPGMNVLTGETGAGKSIVVGALGLLVGGRATSDLVRTGEERARVQATIEIDRDEELILRREVTAQGRSRAFIGDTLATIGALQEVGRQIVDLHGQHDHQALLDVMTHLNHLDAYADLTNEVDAVARAYRVWRNARARLEQARGSERERAERVDLLTFQRDEIRRVGPEAGEDAALHSRRTRLANAERLAQLCGDAYTALYERDDAILARLGQLSRSLDDLAALDELFAPYAEEHTAVESQLEDLAFALRSYRASIDVSPDELNTVEARLSELERLKRKYGPTLEDVRRHGDRADAELMTLTANAEQRDALAEEEQQHRTTFCRHGEVIGQARRAAALRLSADLQRVLSRLGIPHAHFETRFASEPLPETAWTERGLDAAEFYFSANPGEALRPLAKVASGGELSRVMLALKSLACTDRSGKTLVFDEVDAGIGGAVADRVGSMLRALGERYQIICVTHLPQIAAYGTAHYHVSKVVQRGRTVTRIEQLAKQGRVTELARLMTGGDSDRAKAGARELLEGKHNTKVAGRKRKA